MRYKSVLLMILGIILYFGPQPAYAAAIIDNYSNWVELQGCKETLDDPRPVVSCNMKLWGDQVIDDLKFDMDKAAKLWAEMVGFKSPEIVGDIAPEIKPGKYSLADKDRLPFAKLMVPMMYERFNEPGAQGKNFAANFTEIEVVPTRQYYMHPTVAKVSLDNKRKTKLGSDGYIDYDTYEGGIPFPKPSGDHEGWEILYNYLESYTYALGEDYLSQTAAYGVDNDFQIDRYGKGDYYVMRLFRRVIQDPKGAWFDKRARKEGTKQIVYYEAFEPRDLYGNAYMLSKRVDPNDSDNFLLYTPLTRRIRKMSSSDRQDQAVGLDYAYDDVNNIDQKLTPEAYPYETRLVEEREFLVPMYSLTGDEYYDSKSKFLWRNLKFERRPMYVIEMNQLDSTYIYSKRVYYVDKETFLIFGGEYYDQKGRLWRTYNTMYAYSPETGIFWWLAATYFDHIDVHSTIEQDFMTVSHNSDRSEFSARRLMRGMK